MRGVYSFSVSDEQILLVVVLTRLNFTLLRALFSFVRTTILGFFPSHSLTCDRNDFRIDGKSVDQDVVSPG